MAKRVTALTVLPDIRAAAKRYQALGFEPADKTGDTRCIGMLAGKTGILLVTTAFCAEEFGADLAVRLEGRTIDYIYVDAVEESFAALPGATILKDVHLSGGTHEMLVEDETGIFILADTRSRAS